MPTTISARTLDEMTFNWVCTKFNINRERQYIQEKIHVCNLFDDDMTESLNLEDGRFLEIDELTSISAEYINQRIELFFTKNKLNISRDDIKVQIEMPSFALYITYMKPESDRNVVLRIIQREKDAIKKAHKHFREEIREKLRNEKTLKALAKDEEKLNRIEGEYRILKSRIERKRGKVTIETLNIKPVNRKIKVGSLNAQH